MNKKKIIRLDKLCITKNVPFSVNLQENQWNELPSAASLTWSVCNTVFEGEAARPVPGKRVIIITVSVPGKCSSRLLCFEDTLTVQIVIFFALSNGELHLLCYHRILLDDSAMFAWGVNKLRKPHTLMGNYRYSTGCHTWVWL